VHEQYSWGSTVSCTALLHPSGRCTHLVRSCWSDAAITQLHGGVGSGAGMWLSLLLSAGLCSCGALCATRVGTGRVIGCTAVMYGVAYLVGKA
jgi:hypothetical protein